MSKKTMKKRGWTKRVLGHEFLESRAMLSGSPWQNPISCNDLNDDGSVSPSDALIAINSLNSGVSGNLAGKLTAPTASGSSSSYLDANGDGSLSPADPLSVINALNSGAKEGEADADDTSAEDQPGEIGADVPELTLTNGFARVRAELDATDDVDVFQVTASAAVLNVALFTRLSGDVTVSIVNANGDVLATASTADTEGHRPAVASVEVQADTSYFVVVSGDGEATGDYCLQVINSDETISPPEHGPHGGTDDGDSEDTDDDSENTEHPVPLTPTELFAKLDADADGSLTLEEFSTLPAPKHADDNTTAADVFAKLDTDASSGLSLEEFAVLFAKPAEGGERGGHGPVPGGRGPGGHGAPPGAPPSPETIFTKLDADADGSLTEEEFTEFVPTSSKVPADEIFAAWDTDADSLLSLSEFSAGLATLKHR